MLSFLFWNLDKKPLETRVARLTARYDIDVLMLAECVTDPGEMLKALNAEGKGGYCFPFSESKKLRVFTRLAESSLLDKFNHPLGMLTIRQLRPPGAPSILLVVVHLPSKMDWDPHDQTGGADPVGPDHPRG
jgi:hypothetical protein